MKDPKDPYDDRVIPSYYECVLALNRAEVAYNEMARMKPHMKTELMKEKTAFLRKMEAELDKWEKIQIKKLLKTSY